MEINLKFLFNRSNVIYKMFTVHKYFVKIEQRSRLMLFYLKFSNLTNGFCLVPQ